MDIQKKRKSEKEPNPKKADEKKAPIFSLGQFYDSNEVPYFVDSDYESSNMDEIVQPIVRAEPRVQITDNVYSNHDDEKIKNKKSDLKFSFLDLFLPQRLSIGFNFKKVSLNFAFLSLVVFCAIFSAVFVSKGLHIKERVLGVSDSAYENLDSAIENLKTQNFSNSARDFEEAEKIFSSASDDIDEIGSVVTEVSYHIPYASKLSTGKNLTDAGKNISSAGKNFSEIAGILYDVKEGAGKNGFGDNSILDIFYLVEGKLADAQQDISNAQENLSKIKIEDVPKDKREEVLRVKNAVNEFDVILKQFVQNTHIFTDLFGGNGPRKYLFLFQNNNEIRATGGFIGSYGLLDVNDGKIRKFFIDGIFNPDGQLIDKIVPPKPIQKISAAWSLHDSNWFPDFPKSARKAMLFYEKTGGPTVDGVITFTPVVMQKLLKITGPIYMEEYDVMIDSDNFIEEIQFEVEVDYDRDENRPKKILADLAPMVLEKLMNSGDLPTIMKMAEVFDELLMEKHILIYSSNDELQKTISKLGWSGEILASTVDYLSVINSNINGYKTDGVVDEKIEHEVEIMKNGEVFDTVTITRTHNGGDTNYEWWNKVNADYMRVYVPKGSQLISARGNTREINESPLDYDALGFERDDDVEQEESGMVIDGKTTTRIYDDGDKTVFANWVYVSPKEEVVVEYKYKLPFKIEIDDENVADTYSLLIQKQSGSRGSDFQSEVKYPENLEIEWKTSDDIELRENKLFFGEKLTGDDFLGVIFKSK